MPKIVMCALMAGSMLYSCMGDDEDDAPPPPPTTATAPQPVNNTQNLQAPPPQPAGQVMITVAASSTPPGATVTGGGRQLGVTPLQTQVPVPAPVPGQVQSFAFTFELAGYQTATINATPVNNTISITAALAPAMQPQEVPVAGTEGEEGDDGGPEITVQGRVPDGRIFDNHQTIGTAEVGQPCTIDRLRVRLNGNHTFNSDLYVSVRGPNGQSYMLQRSQRTNPFRAHIVRRAVGQQAQGRWTLIVDDRVGQDSGTLRGWSLGLRCRP